MNKIKASVFLFLTMLLVGCDSDRQFFIDDFEKNHQEVKQKLMSNGGVTILKTGEVLNYGVSFKELSDASINFFGHEREIKTWAVSCDEPPKSICNLRFRDGKKGSSKVVGVSVTQYQLQKLINAISDFKNNDLFVQFTINGSVYYYNEYDVSESIGDNILITKENGSIVIKPLVSPVKLRDGREFSNDNFAIKIGSTNSEMFKEVFDNYFHLIIIINNEEIVGEKTIFDYF